ncbi:MAG: serine hydrolase [Chitinophagaceae bacterium]|nr:serine hydrolase [Chitinophagaceae bacterium]
MRNILSVIALLFFLPAIAQKKSAKPTDPLKGIEPLLEQVLKDRKGVGFAVAVVYKDSIVYAKGFGYRDLDKKLPVTPQTLFAIGSCTKAFTSSLIGLLNKEGKVEYDKPVRDYLPELEFYNNEMNQSVTLRDMMCHRTGLPRHDYSWYLFKTNSRDSLLRRIKYQEPTTPIRQNWQYNNFMFLGQGMVVEKLTKKSWENNIKETFFKPLGMKRSNFSVKDLEKSDDASLGYGVVNDSIIKKLDYYDINAMGPAGSINSSVTEMAQWVMTWIQGGKYKGVEILPAAYVAEAMSSQMISRAGLPDKEIPDAHFSTYGFGWMMSSYRGHYRVEHGGNIDGFSASTCFFPSDSLGIIVLSNQNASGIPALVRNIISDRWLKLTPIDWNKRANDAEEKARKAAAEGKGKKDEDFTPGTKPSHELKAYEGLFRHEGYGTVDISLRNDSLIMFTPNGDAWMRHHHYDVFKAYAIDTKEGIDTSAEAQTVLVQYQMDINGKINSLSMGLEPSLKPLVFNSVPRPMSLTEEDLKKFTGEYAFTPTNLAKFYTKGKSILYLFVEGQPEYELIPNGKNEFKLKIIEGYSCKFEEDAEGKIISVTFLQPNGKFKATKTK